MLGWSPDGKSVLFASSRGDDFLGTLYVVPLDGGAETKAGTDYGHYGSFSPDGTKLAVNRKGQSYWRKAYRGSYQTDVTVVDLKSKTFQDVTSFLGMDTWPMWGSDGHIYFVSDRDENAQSNLWRVPEGRRRGGADHDVHRWRRAVSRDQRRRQDDRVRARFPAVEARRGDAQAERDSAFDQRRVAGHADRISHGERRGGRLRRGADRARNIVAAVRGELFLVPVGEEGDLMQLTKGAARDRNVEFSPDGKLIAFVSDKESGREEIYVVPADGSSEPRSA